MKEPCNYRNPSPQEEAMLLWLIDVIGLFGVVTGITCVGMFCLYMK